ncbi:hypothetical protein PU630_11695 [Microbacterium horticulturae]|uniref:Uncharacterized protein n=1 Tax=Microbacterium horticulturae TaxID=3028316 RepID=A0ABY8BZ80_9MICO|nr:hypothetical protein [Microbacterium sp. KACC 23027]WEG07903.1 hypothetical protein PU630_11695 [Microbacterium sp. KACC 23027]
MIYREVECGRDLDNWMQRSLSRFATNEEFVRAYTLLPTEDHHVVHWAERKRDEIRRLIDLAHEEVADGTTTVGPNRSHAARLAAETTEEFLSWRRGTRDAASFSVDLL